MWRGVKEGAPRNECCPVPRAGVEVRGEGRRLHCLPMCRGGGRKQGVLRGGRKAPWEPREVRRRAPECPGTGAACGVPGGKPGWELLCVISRADFTTWRWRKWALAGLKGPSHLI